MTWQRVYVAPVAFQLPPYLFDQQREACVTCRHVSRTGDEGMWCDAAYAGCSQARLPGEACGPDATLRNLERTALPGSRMARLLAALGRHGRMTVEHVGAELGISRTNARDILGDAMAEGRISRDDAARPYTYALAEALPQLRDAA
jgi:hypothetical protein